MYMKINIIINNKTFVTNLENNRTAQAFYNLLPLTLNMSAMPHEKYYYLEQKLPTNTYKPHFIEQSDLMLYGSSCIVLFYESFPTPFSYSKIGKIQDSSHLSNELGKEYIVVTFDKIENRI